MNISRPIYLQQLINRMNNGMIKIVTGLRRCGKSYLLFELFKEYLLSSGVKAENIIGIELDRFSSTKYRDPAVLLDYLNSKINENEKCYIMLDEIQMLKDFSAVLNELLHYRNVDVYVTGSNSKFLSTDILTEFRGRGDAAKYEAHLAMHEAALRAMKQSLTASFRHFFWTKKWRKSGVTALDFFSPEHYILSNS